MSLTFSAQNAEVLTFSDESGNYIRWQGYAEADLVGYNVYRSTDGNNWTKQNDAPITPLLSSAALESELGYKANLFYALLGKESTEGNVSVADLSKVRKDADSRSFFEAMCLVNPEFGNALGEIYHDQTAVSTVAYYYEVKVVTGSGEKAHSKQVIQVAMPESIPAVEGLVAGVAHESVELRWDKLSEAMKAGDVVSYNVYRSTSEDAGYQLVNGYNQLSVDASVGGKSIMQEGENFVDKFLSNGTPYYYHVKAINAFGIEGPASITLRVVPNDFEKPIPPTQLESERLGGIVKLTWSSINDEEDSYNLYASGSRTSSFKPRAKISATARKSGYLLDDITAGEEQYVYLTAVSATGVESDPSDTLRIFTPDTKPPAPPTNVKVSQVDGALKITWTASRDNDVDGYFVERTGDDEFVQRFQLNKDLIKGTSYIDELDEKSQREYGYVVIAVDRGFNKSKPSEMAKGRMPDIVPPHPSIITGVEVEDGTAHITWTRCIDSDFSAYTLMMASSEEGPFDEAAQVAENSTKWELGEDGDYFFYVKTMDEAINFSEPSNVIKIEFERRKTPDAPADGTVEVQGNGLLVKWEAVTHEGVNGYVVTRKNLSSGKLISVAELGEAFLEFFDVYADPTIDYEYTIKTYDEQWRMSKPLRLQYEAEE